MKDMLAKIKETANYLRSRNISSPFAGIVLGTGLGAFADLINVEQKINYSDIPNFPLATVEFHKGQLFYGSIGTKKIVAMQGRFHYYEGYSMQEITFPIRVMKELGVQYLLLSNAAGGMNADFKKGDIVLIEDHINLMPDNPLRGLNDEQYGNRFVDMSCPYSKEINAALIKSAKRENVLLKTGTYVSVPGPNLETRAEYEYLHAAGADMVGMSTVPEVIVANHAGMQCAAVSVITDECDPENLKPVNIAEIIEVAGVADKILSKIFAGAIESL